MPGRSTAPRAGDALRERVAALGRNLGLEARTEVRVGRRIWGAERFIDVVLMQRETRLSLGVEFYFGLLEDEEEGDEHLDEDDEDGGRLDVVDLAGAAAVPEVGRREGPAPPRAARASAREVRRLPRALRRGWGAFPRAGWRKD